MATTKRKKRKSDPPDKRTTPNRWDDRYYVKVHEMVLQGMSQTQIAKALGIHHSKWFYLIKRLPALREIIDGAGKSKHLNQVTQHAGETFAGMVWRRLPHDLQKLWEDLEGIHRGPNGDALEGGEEYPDTFERIERLFNTTGRKKAKQFLFFHALAGSNFNVTEACRKVNVAYMTLKKWCKDPAFKRLMDEDLPRIMGDMAEGYVWRAAKQGEPAILKHMMEGFIADRGYAKKRQVTDPNANGVQVTVNVQSVLNELPLEERIKMLNAYRAAQAKAQAPKVVHELPLIEPDPADIEEPLDYDIE